MLNFEGVNMAIKTCRKKGHKNSKIKQNCLLELAMLNLFLLFVYAKFDVSK